MAGEPRSPTGHAARGPWGRLGRAKPRSPEGFGFSRPCFGGSRMVPPSTAGPDFGSPPALRPDFTRSGGAPVTTHGRAGDARGSMPRLVRGHGASSSRPVRSPCLGIGQPTVPSALRVAFSVVRGADRVSRSEAREAMGHAPDRFRGRYPTPGAGAARDERREPSGADRVGSPDTDRHPPVGPEPPDGEAAEGDPREGMAIHGCRVRTGLGTRAAGRIPPAGGSVATA
jgi:hypothetical protein